jgi:nucleotide-binding universal stress UspA family protein
MMARFARILFATDFSKSSANAFATAVALAKATRGTLTILHVIVPRTPVVTEQYIGSQTWEEIDLQARKWAQRQLASLVAQAKKAGIRSAPLIVDGQAARQIVRVAQTRRADLLVVGTHGRTGLAKWFVGSVAARVVAMAQCPVVTVRGGT